MRPLGEFIRSRIFRVGYPTQAAFIDETELGKPTVNRVLKISGLGDLAKIRASTLEVIAEKLGFSEWFQLVQAWSEDDVLWGLKHRPEEAISAWAEKSASDLNVSTEDFQNALQSLTRDEMRMLLGRVVPLQRTPTRELRVAAKPTELPHEQPRRRKKKD